MSKCMICGKPVPEGDNCCLDCFNTPKPEIKKKPDKNERTCKNCGKRFLDTIYDDGAFGRVLFCSTPCREQYYSTHGKAIHCFWCGKEFRGHHGALYCSTVCRVASHRSGKTPDRKKPTEQRPPLLKLRFQILHRDGFKCRYCGRSVNDGIELHIDHINPQSNGGTWNEDNLLTACRECNLGKSDFILTNYPPQR